VTTPIQTTGSPRREELLQAAVAYAGAHGLSQLSLRPLAAAVGSSPRVLLYLFGSKDGLIRAVLDTARAQQRDLVTAALAEDPTDLPGLVRRLWAWLAADEQRDVTRLFFDAFTRSLTAADCGPWTDFARTSVDDWQDMLRQAAVGAGRDEQSATAHATLYLAVLRGLLLDLHATGDRPRLDAALNALLAAPVR
jgi:AcrR family transcriptional regulator